MDRRGDNRYSFRRRAARVRLGGGVAATDLPRWCVFTTEVIAGRLLDEVGWQYGADLTAARLLEPAAGTGNIAVVAAERLLRALSNRGLPLDQSTLADRIVCVEIRDDLHAELRRRLMTELRRFDVPLDVAGRVAKRWARRSDFLEDRPDGPFTHAVGNPPYRRQERTLANACVSFMDAAFESLSEGGRMAMLCPVTIASAAGGGGFRRRVGRLGRLLSIAPLRNEQVYESPVAVPPAICVIQKGHPAADGGSEGWLLADDALTRVVRSCSRRMPSLAEAGVRVRLGLATGANDVFLCRADDASVERELLVPCAAIGDLAGPRPRWRGRSVIDVFAASGTVVERGRFPRLDAHLDAHKERLRAREHPVARRDWRRTIQRPDRALAKTPKVLIGETGRHLHVGCDNGELLPLNSVHALVSTQWPPHALASALAVGAGIWAEAFGCRRPGGDLRLNATNLKRVRLPRWQDVRTRLREGLTSNCEETRLSAAGDLYGLNAEQIERVAAYGWLQTERVRDGRQATGASAPDARSARKQASRRSRKRAG